MWYKSGIRNAEASMKGILVYKVWKMEAWSCQYIFLPIGCKKGSGRSEKYSHKLC